MIAFESVRGRRIVGRIEHGEDLFVALAALVREQRITTGWLSATGAFLSAEFQTFDASTRGYVNTRPVEACDVLHLNGSITTENGAPSFSLHAVVSRKEAGAPVVQGGKLRAAIAVACEFMIECVDDLEIERGWDSASGMSLWRAAANSRRSAPPPPRESWAARAASKTQSDDEDDAPMSWGTATATAERMVTAEKVILSPRAARRDALTTSSEPAFVPPPLPEKRRTNDRASIDTSDAPDPVPVAGDYISHKQFGLCRVDGEDDEGGVVIRLPSGIRKSIRLDVMRVLPATLDGDRRVYQVEPRRR